MYPYKHLVGIIGTARIGCGAGSMKWCGVCQSVPAWAHSSKPAAVDLLLWAQEISIDRCTSSRQKRAVPT